MLIKPIETDYRGIRYRSRMEARWAVFMDHLDIPFFYEHEAYNLDGVRYLPDFFLPEQDFFIEVKNPENVSADSGKVSSLAMATGKKAFLFQCPPTFPDFKNIYLEGALCFFPDGPPGSSDEHHLWCQCRNCGRYDIQYDGRSERIKCKCPKGGEVQTYNASSLRHAYDIARSWRFEPGADNP